jgi:hypothetical protein
MYYFRMIFLSFSKRTSVMGHENVFHVTMRLGLHKEMLARSIIIVLQSYIK